MATIPKAAKKKGSVEEESNSNCKVMAKDDDIILAILDTYHDFCKGERVTQSARKKKAEQEEKSEKGSVVSDSEDEEGDPKRVEIMREYLPQLVQSIYGARKVGKSYQENIKILTCNEVTSVSSIEHSAVDMFESKQPFRDILNAKPESKEVLTFDQIISAYHAAPDKNDIPLWNNYRNGLQNSILELSKSGRRYGKGTASEADEKKELEILSSFILNYFFFTDAPPGDVYMTFDAGERIVGDIFHDRDNVKCVIFPETLADSATTSLGMLAGRNEFLYPSTSKIIEFTSNLFTRDKYKIYFENKGFGDQNPYGFTLVIESVANPGLKLTMPFSPKQTEGPSVNYLIDILDNAQKGAADKIPYAAIKKKGTILNLGAALDANKAFCDQFEKEIKEHTNGILPDLKRGGDHEAVLISKVAETFQGGKYKNFVFCTIDILCALKSRLEQINTIWQGKDKIILYRYPRTIPTEIVKVKLIEKGKEMYDLLTKLKTFLTVNLTDDLNKQLANFEMGKEADVDYSDREKITPYKIRCEEALNALLRIVMLDLTEYIQSFKDTVSFTGLDKDALAKIDALTLFYSEFYSESLDTLKTRVDESGVYSGHDINAEFKEVLSFYTTVTENVKKYIHLEINAGQETEVMKSDKTLVRTYQIQKPVISQKPNSTDPKEVDVIFLLQEHPVFGFNPAIFEKFYDALMYIHEITKKNIERPARDYSKTMNKILSGDITAPYDYFELIDDLVNQFQTETYRTAIRDIVDFRRKPTGAAKTKNQLEEERIKHVVGVESMTNKDGGEGDDDSTHLENGVINNLRSYYKSLVEGNILAAELTTLTYVPPAPPRSQGATVAVEAQTKGRKRGGAQSGGDLTSIFQYYDLNDLLYKISSMAAAFIESAYSQEFPQYVVYNKFRRLETYFKKVKGTLSSKQSDEIQLHLKDLLQQFTTLYKDPDIFPSIEAYSGRAQRYTAWDAQVNVIQIHLSTPNLEKAFDECTTGLKLFLKTDDDAGEILVPTIEEFLQRVSSDAYSVLMEDEWTVSNDGVVVPPKTEQLDTLLYEDICMTWQAGLYEIRQNKEYYYRYSEVDDLLSYFVSLRNRTILESIEASSNNNENSNFEENEENEENAGVGETAPTSSNVIITSTLGTELQFIDSTTGIAHTSTSSSLLRRIHELNEVIGTAKAKNISIATSVLFMLTLIENIMNTTKQSFFIQDTYKRSQFQSHTLWDTRVYALLTQLSASMNVSFDKNKLSLGLASYGGSRSYPKKTRKHAAKKRSRTSKKYKKTRRVR